MELLKNKNRYLQLGQSVIEVIVAASIIAIIGATLVVSFLSATSLTLRSKQQQQASALSQAAIDTVHSYRNESWSNLGNGTYYLEEQSGEWILSNSDPGDTFTTTIIIQDAYRDGSGNLTETPGTLESDAKFVDLSVSWQNKSGSSQVMENEFFTTRWFKATSVNPDATPPPDPNQESCTDFCQGSGYSSGTCRANPNQCTDNGETYESGGDAGCPGDANSDTCCCAP